MIEKIQILMNSLKSFFHIHFFSKPIVSKYISFHARKIIYECRCGKRKSKMVRKSFSETFPIPTDIFLTEEQFELIERGSVNPSV